MKSSDAMKEFEQQLATRGLNVAQLTPGQGLERMPAFYRDVRATDCNIAEQGDMLLYQWGVYDWGKGPQFELELARQLVAVGGEDDDIWQLHLTFRFAPSGVLHALGRGDRWCQSLDEVDEFATFLMSHPAKVAVAHRSDAAVELWYDQAG